MTKVFVGVVVFRFFFFFFFVFCFVFASLFLLFLFLFVCFFCFVLFFVLFRLFVCLFVCLFCFCLFVCLFVICSCITKTLKTVCFSYSQQYYAHRAKLAVIDREKDIEKINRQALKLAREVANSTGTLMTGNICNTTLYNPNDPEWKQQVAPMFKVLMFMFKVFKFVSFIYFYSSSLQDRKYYRKAGRCPF